jgi:membrane protein YdbS with pleckstrin-like domain
MSKAPSYGNIGNRALKLMVILLCSINAAMWEFYTESRIMALVWVAVAIAFVAWIIDDMRR